MYLDKAKAYNETNCLQRQDAEDTLNEFASRVKWLIEGGDSVLHIGSRSGDVLFDYVFPLLPKNFRRLVGIDKSEEMISYAIENYHHPKLTFERADITNEDDINKLLNRFGQFNHITTLCSLHWVMDQELAFKNIFNLLAPHGDILITMCESHPLYEHYRDMMALDKWSDYQEQMQLSTSPYFGASDPVKMLNDILEKVGFNDIHVELKERKVRYEKQVFIDATSQNVPILCHLPESLRIEFLSIYEHKVMQMSQNMYKSNNITIPYRMLIAYAKKENNTNTDINYTQTRRDYPLQIDEVRMHNAKCYHDTNFMQREDALDTITEYQRFYQWSPKGNDYLLEIGIGCGDITYDYILPIIPQKTQIVASDKSQEMLDYARLNFSHPRISFAKLDIESENDVNDVLRKYGQFQHITSFFAIHWANQHLAMENIFRLLQPGGEVFMTLVQSHVLYEQYADIYDFPKWTPFKRDMIKTTSPYFRNESPEKELYRRMERAGFVDINIALKKRLCHFDSQLFIDSIVPVVPFLDKVSESLKQEFIQIYNNKVMTMNLPAPYKSNKERNDGKTLIPFCMLVAHARKPSTEDTHAWRQSSQFRELVKMLRTVRVHIFVISLFFVLSIGVSMHNPFYCYAEDPIKPQIPTMFSAISPYELIRGRSIEPSVSSCTPSKFWLVGRSVAGWNEVQGIAQRYQAVFPTLLPSTYSLADYSFRSMNQPGMISSIAAFADGLFGLNGHQQVDFENIDDPDLLLLFHTFCPLFDEVNAPTIEVNAFEEGPELQQMITQVSNKLGFHGSHILSAEQIRTPLTSNMNSTSSLCAAFSIGNFEVLAYHRDLHFFYRYGYGHFPNYRRLYENLPCHLVQDMLHFLRSNELNDRRARILNGRFYTVLLTLNVLGAYEDQFPLNRHNFAQQTLRLWKLSQISPKAANLAVIRYDCPDADNDVLFLHNEKPLLIDGCQSNGLCKLAMILERFSRYLDVNCAESFCSNF
ncbi:hypothetical protein HA402_013502 [Bradysia odoriphaga]|nr:hypothetical protein HA402_013502 [Bradysia odoriphaga]